MSAVTRTSDQKRTTILLVKRIDFNFGVGRLLGSVFFLLLHVLQPSFAQTLGVPKAAFAPKVGTWNYRSESNVGEKQKTNSVATYSTTVKDAGDAWTVTVAMKFPEGPVTGVGTLDKGTLILRKVSFRHFVHPDQRWKPVAIDLDFKGNRVTGTSTNANEQTKSLAFDLTGPIFADVKSLITIGCLPLADGYSTTVRDWDVLGLQERLWQLKVLGTERVTVPAGTFDTYKVELTATDATGDKQTAWIDKDVRVPVKIDAVDKLYGVIRTEMVP